MCSSSHTRRLIKAMIVWSQNSSSKRLLNYTRRLRDLLFIGLGKSGAAYWAQTKSHVTACCSSLQEHQPYFISYHESVLYDDINIRTIENQQCIPIFRVNYWFKVQVGIFSFWIKWKKKDFCAIKTWTYCYLWCSYFDLLLPGRWEEWLPCTTTSGCPFK